MLTGFLLVRDLERWLASGVRSTLRSYTRRRAWRVLPAYWVSLAGAVALLWGGSPSDGIRLPPADMLWAFVVLVQNYFADTVMRLNPVTWTLVVEVAFYVLLPLVAAGFAAARWRSVPAIAGLLIAVTLGFNWLLREMDWPLTAAKSPFPFLAYFGLGLLAGWAARRRGLVPFGGGTLRGGAALGLFAAGLVIVVAEWRWLAGVQRPSQDVAVGVLQHIPAAVGFALMIFAAAAASGALRTWLSFAPVVWLGERSYGFFLWHLPVLLALHRLGDWDVGWWAGTALVMSLVLAGVSWRWLEAPLLRRMRAREQAARAATA